MRIRRTRALLGRSLSLALALALALALLLVSGCGSDEESADDVVETGDISIQEAALAGGWDAVSWTGDGRFAVLQTFDGDGMPTVMAWDSETGEVITVAGYVVISLEPASSRIWLEPKTAEHVATEMLEAPEYTYLDLGPFDEPVAHMELWDPGADDEPTRDVPEYYAPHDGGMGVVAYYEVDPTVGGLPGGLFLSDGETRDEGYPAELPDDFVTFSVIGWSPSGEYVAIEELTQKDVALQAAAGLDGEAVDYPQRRVLIIEAATGDIAEETEFGGDVIAPAQWLGDSDVLVWAVDSLETGTYGLVALEIGGTAGDFTQVTGVELPAELLAGTPPYPLGNGTFGLTLVTWDYEGSAQMWRVDSVAVEPMGSFDRADQIAWSQAGGVAILTYEISGEGGDEYVMVGVASESGGTPELVITGPSRPGYGTVVEE